MMKTETVNALRYRQAVLRALYAKEGPKTDIVRQLEEIADELLRRGLRP